MSENKVSTPEGTEPISGGPARTGLQVTSIFAGWVGLTAIVVGLLWAAVVKSFPSAPLVFIMAGGALVIFWLVVNIAMVVAAAKGRQARLIFNSAAFIMIIVGIVVLVNYIGARHHLRTDLTESKRYSLSEQTHEVAKALEQEVKLIAFVSTDYYNWGEVQDRLREYEMLSPKISVEHYDPKTDFAKAKEYDIQLDGTVLVKSGEKTERVTGGSEEQLTSAILAVTSGEKTKVYFLIGHGEPSLEGSGPNVIGTLKRSLENQQYAVETLSLMAMENPQVPLDCAILAIIGPKQPLHEKEIDALSQYLRFGGKLFAAIDPTPAPSLEEILADYGIMPMDGIVLDPQLSLWGQLNVPIVNAPATHQITSNLGAVILPVTRAFDIESPEEEPQYPGMPPPSRPTALLQSSPASWLEKSVEGQPQKDPDEPAGPLVMAALVDQTTPPPPMMPGMAPPPRQDGARMVVAGTSIMVSDDLVRQGVDSGVYFTLKSIAWLVENEKLISIPPKDIMPSRVMLSAPQPTVAIITVFALPVLIMLAGAVVWWRRRRG